DRLAVRGQRLRLVVELEAEIAEALEHLGALHAVARILGDAAQINGRLLLLAALERQLRERAQRRPVVAAQLQRRFVEIDRAFRMSELDLRLGGVRERVRDLLRVEGGVRMIDEAAEVKGGL